MKGIWREGFIAEDPEGYAEKALEMGISFHRGPVLGNMEEGSSSGDFERRMKWALMRLRGGGLWGGGSFTGNPGRYVQIISGYGHLSP